MMPQIKDDWRGESAASDELAEQLNMTGKWVKYFRVVSPLVAVPENGSLALGMMTQAGTPFDHPWRLGVDVEEETYTVAGGRVHDGQEWHAVSAIGETALADPTYVWLRVKHYNNAGTASQYVLDSGGSLPASSYSTDVLPNSPRTSMPAAGWCEIIIPVAKYSAADGVQQYRVSDVTVPYGMTYTRKQVLDVYWSGSVLRCNAVVELHVCGRLVGMSTLTDVALFDTGPCPTPAT